MRWAVGGSLGTLGEPKPEARGPTPARPRGAHGFLVAATGRARRWTTALLLLFGCSGGETVVESAPAVDAAAAEAAVRALLDAQAEAWNAGDVETFMTGYLEEERLRFVSGAEVRRGWEATLQRYRDTYPDAGSMGRLTFDDLEVRIPAADVALVTGAWRLEREADEPHGRYTLVLEKGPAGWRIVYDHTSSAPAQ